MIAAAALAGVVFAACGGDDATAICSPEERIIEPSSLHVIGDTEVVYENSPPTSGPHQVPAPTSGARLEPLSEPLQVGALESGAVILQYQPEVTAAAASDLAELGASDGVLVAPAVRAFDGDAVVAFTAWGVRQLCSAVDLDAATAFIDQHAGTFFVNHE